MEHSGTICRHRVLAAVVCLTILLVPDLAAAAPAVNNHVVVYVVMEKGKGR